MIAFMACGFRSLLEGITDGVFGASNRVLYLARCLLRGAFGLGLRVAGNLPDALLDGAFYLMSRALNTIFSIFALRSCP
jgi:hypothetical protein